MADRLALVAEQDRFDRAKNLSQQVTDQVGQIVLGKDAEIRLALTCLLAGGHLLIEDVPGVGKTLLARSLATVRGLDFRRIQFTSDMLPARSLIRPLPPFGFTADPCLPNSSWPTRSTGPRPRRKARCWRPWKSIR